MLGLDRPQNPSFNYISSRCVKITPRQMRTSGVFATKIELYSSEFPNKLVYSMWPGTSLTANSTRESNGGGGGSNPHIMIPS